MKKNLKEISDEISRVLFMMNQNEKEGLEYAYEKDGYLNNLFYAQELSEKLTEMLYERETEFRKEMGM